MKWFSILTLILMITLILSGCGAQATPTANPIDLQSTVAAVAFTMLAQTQAAIPTATPFPPTATITDTPPPTNTFLPLPASEVPSTPAPGDNSSGQDPCVNKPLPATLQGETVKLRLNNSTNAALAMTVYLNQTVPQIECGYRTYNIDPGGSVAINDMVEGCYTIWAWNPDPKEYFIVTNGTNCLDNSSTWVFDISTRSIELK
jgi:uncharacterized protein YceK